MKIILTVFSILLLVASLSFSYWSTGLSIGYDLDSRYSLETESRYTWGNSISLGGLIQANVNTNLFIDSVDTGIILDKTFYFSKLDITPLVKAGVTIGQDNWIYWVFPGARVGYSFGNYSIFIEGGYKISILPEERTWKDSWKISIGSSFKPAFAGL